MKRLPKKLVLCGLTYEVKLVDYINPDTVKGGEKGDVVLGAFDRTNHVIEILRSLHPERREVILLHEVLHALCEDLDVSEVQIDLLSWRLYDCLNRNRLDIGLPRGG